MMVPGSFFFSTSEVYGDGRRENGLGGVENFENDPSRSLQLPDLRDPRSSYPFSKIVGEFILISLQTRFACDPITYMVLRWANVM